jgi:hypothetical protein
MIDAVAQLFAAPEHHGGSGTQSKFVRGAVHIFPIVAGAFEARDSGADFIIENFRPAAGDGFADQRPSVGEWCLRR